MPLLYMHGWNEISVFGEGQIAQTQAAPVKITTHNFTNNSTKKCRFKFLLKYQTYHVAKKHTRERW